jgi:hypothetical protein
MSLPDLVLGALAGRRKVGPPTVFVESLRASGANARLVVFVNDVADETLRVLARAGATTIPFRFWRSWNGPIHAWRFVLFERYVARHFGAYRHIMTADMRVVIQADPFAGMDFPAVQFFLENAAYTIATERFYAEWMRQFIPRALHETYGANRLACCGIILGGAPEMRDYLRALSTRLRAVPWPTRRRIGADSAMHNLIAHVTHDVPGRLIENNGRVATMGLEPPGTYHIDEAGRIACADGHVPPICHQYDRSPDLFGASRYAKPWPPV